MYRLMNGWIVAVSMSLVVFGVSLYSSVATADSTTIPVNPPVSTRATKTTISLDKSSASGGDNQCTTLTTTSKAEGPALTESTAGQLANGMFVYLKAPAGFEFCSPFGTTTAVVSKAGSASTNLTLGDGTGDGTVAAEPVLSGTDTLAVTIKVSSAGSGVATIWFRGVSVRPTGTTPLSSAQIQIG